eukprot:GFUD01044981.1.p1 GENE.GFUD01044981.1~~GFUD01044981.1.p1  ORF type:complete len:798 (+),score=247.32 GFUD01044981.1:135-2528(+)
MSSLTVQQPQPTVTTVPSFQITDTSHLAVLRKLCSFLSHHSLVSTLPPLPTRYPQFLGSDEAAKQAAALPEFISAGVVLVSQGVAVMSDVVLQEGKMLVSPIPGLREEKVFQQLVRNELVEETGEGRKSPKYQRLEVKEDLEIDLLVVGSMVVDEMGRRIGKKRERVGLEFVLGGQSLKKVVVVTMVHDCQVVEGVPETMFSAQDVAVDIIVTPTKVIRIKNRMPKPDKILWSIVTKNMMENIPLLESTRKKDKDAGMEVKLAVRSVERVRNREFGERSRVREVEMGCKVKLQPLPKELKYSELKNVLREKVEPGFKVGVLKFGMAIAFFKETNSMIIEKLQDLTIGDEKVEIEVMEFVKKEEKIVADEDTTIRKKLVMKSKFKFENIGNAQSDDLKEALNKRSVHFGFLKIFKNSGVAIVLFQEEATEVIDKLEGLAIGDNAVVVVELELEEKREKKSPKPPKETSQIRSPRLSQKEVKLKEMKSKFKFKNLGNIKVSALKGILRESKVDPGFIVVFKKFEIAIVMFKEKSADIIRKLKGLKVAENEVEYEEIELEYKKTTRSRKVSVSDKRARTIDRSSKNTLSQKSSDQGLSAIFIGSLPRNVTEDEIKEAVGKKDANAAHIELFSRKGFAFAYFDKKPEDLLNKLKDLTVKERVCTVEVKRSPPRSAMSGVVSVEQPTVEGIVENRRMDKKSKDAGRKMRNKKNSSLEDGRNKKNSTSEYDRKNKNVNKKSISSPKEEKQPRTKKSSSTEDEETSTKKMSTSGAIGIGANVHQMKEESKAANGNKSGKKPRGT